MMHYYERGLLNGLRMHASENTAGWTGQERTMGLTHVTVRVSDLMQVGTPFEAEFLVDTGAIDCLAPSDRLLAAGIKPEKKEVYELANGQPIECECGFARLSFMGEETVSPIIFGPSQVAPILGVLALESIGVVVDPVTKKLKRLHAKPLK
jgi:predicted aspartyl protease